MQILLPSQNIFRKMWFIFGLFLTLKHAFQAFFALILINVFFRHKTTVCILLIDGLASEGRKRGQI